MTIAAYIAYALLLVFIVLNTWHRSELTKAEQRLKDQHEDLYKQLKEIQTLNETVARMHYDAIAHSLPVNHQFTLDEISSLVVLCHPDKHDGKASAVTMTQKLLKLRRS